jgi:hypothetical protein
MKGPPQGAALPQAIAAGAISRVPVRAQIAAKFIAEL